VNAITKPQSHADTAATALRQALTASHAQLRESVASYRTAWSALTAAADLLDLLRATGGLVLAAEAIVAASKQVEATARTTLAQSVSETGCPAVALAHHVVHLGTKPARVDIEDESAIPAELMRQPAPAPDKTAISRMLRAGAEVPGARLIGNHEPMAVFRSNHQ
jgi:Siphovirus Gp157